MFFSEDGSKFESVGSWKENLVVLKKNQTPQERGNEDPAFTKTGTDLACPFYVTSLKMGNRTVSFSQSFSRFVLRRGLPATVSVSKEIKTIAIESAVVQRFLADKGTV